MKTLKWEPTRQSSIALQAISPHIERHAKHKSDVRLSRALHVKDFIQLIKYFAADDDNIHLWRTTFCPEFWTTDALIFSKTLPYYSDRCVWLLSQLPFCKLILPAINSRRLPWTAPGFICLSDDLENDSGYLCGEM